MKQVRSKEELCDFIAEAGFPPFIDGGAEGFSDLDVIAAKYWYNPIDDTNPWNWRYFVARNKRIAYGKFFRKKLGFVEKKWFPYFAAVRRDGLTFGDLYRAGLASYRMKTVVGLLNEEKLTSKEIMHRSGLKKSAMESALTELTMKTYIVISGFEPQLSRDGESYGWPVARYDIAERCMKREFFESPKESAYLIMEYLKSTFPKADEEMLEKLVLK